MREVGGIPMRKSIMRGAAIGIALALMLQLISHYASPRLIAGAEGAPLQKVSIWSENFDSYEAGSEPDDIVITAQSGTELKVTDAVYAGDSGNSIRLTDNSGNRVSMTKSFEAASNVVLELDVYAENWLEIHLREGSTSGPRFYLKNSGILQYYYGGKFSQFTMRYEVNTWNKFRIEADNTTHTYSAFLNDALIAENIPMENNINQMDTLFIMTNTGVANYTSYLDNLELYTLEEADSEEEPPGEEPGEEEPGENGGGFISLWEQDFEAHTAGVMPDDFQYNLAAGTTATVVDPAPGATGTKALRFADGNNAVASNIVKSFTPSHDVILEMDVYTDNWFEIRLRQGTDTGPRFYLKNFGILEYYLTSEAKFIRIEERYAVNEWNRLRIETDTAAGQYQVYLNDVQIGFNLPMDTPIETIDNLYITTNRTVTNTSYLDNMQISVIPVAVEPPPFDLLLPANDADHVQLPATFSWHPHEAAQSYTLTVAENEDFSAVVYEENVGLATEAVVTGLNFATPYYWKVSAATSEGIVESLQSYRFTTERERSLIWTEDFEAYMPASLPSFISVTTPKGSTVLVSEEQSSGEGNRSLEIADGNESIATKLEWQFNSVRDVILELDVYVNNWLEIHLRNGSDSGPRITFKNNGILEYYRTSDGKFTRLPLTYATDQWMRVRIETNVENYTYKLFINGSQVGGDIPMDRDVDSIDKLYIATNTRLNNYKSYVDNIRVEGYRKEGAPRDFSLLSPSNEAADIESPLTLSWDPSQNAEQYRVLLSRNWDLSDPVVDKTVPAAEGTSLTIDSLQANAEYYWKVIAVNGISETDSRETFSFQTKMTLYPLEFSLLSITDKDQKPVSDLTSLKFIQINGAVLNQTDDNIDGIIAAALYNANDELLEMMFVEKQLGARSEEQIQAGFSLPANSDDVYIKLFVWDQMGEQNFISNQVVFGSQ